MKALGTILGMSGAMYANSGREDSMWPTIRISGQGATKGDKKRRREKKRKKLERRKNRRKG